MTRRERERDIQHGSILNICCQPYEEEEKRAFRPITYPIVGWIIAFPFVFRIGRRSGRTDEIERKSRGIVLLRNWQTERRF